jgi:hypothetical protein
MITINKYLGYSYDTTYRALNTQELYYCFSLCLPKETRNNVWAHTEGTRPTTVRALIELLEHKHWKGYQPLPMHTTLTCQ